MDEVVLGYALAEDFALFGSVLQITVDARKKHLYGRAYDFQMPQLLGGDIHQHIVFVGIGIMTGESLHEILHRSLEFAVAASELFEQKACEPRIGFGNPCIELKFFGMKKHMPEI